MEIRLQNKGKFKAVFIVFILIQLILLTNNLQSTYVGIGLEKKNDTWMIKNFSYPKWAEENKIEKGDIVQEINGISIELLNVVTNSQYIHSAKSITIKNDNTQRTLIISNTDILGQYLTLIILPFLYFLLTLAIVFYIFRNKDFTSAKATLILFLVIISLGYSSIGPSSKKDILGSISINLSMIGCAILLFNFLVVYLKEDALLKYYPKYKIYSYILMTFVLLISIFENISYLFYLISKTLILGLFGLLFVLSLLFLGWSYFFHKNIRAKLILLIFIIPFFPFLFLYILPELLYNKYILSADYTSLSFLFIPISFFLLQASDRLFEIEYYLNRFLYYLNLSLISSSFFTVGVYMINRGSMSIYTTFNTWLFLLIAIVTLFYVKEIFDYNTRRSVLPSKENLIKQLYLFVNRIQNSTTLEDVLKKIQFSFSSSLNLNYIRVIHYTFDHTSPIYYSSLQENKIENMKIGELLKLDHQYLVVIHEDQEHKLLLSFKTSKNRNLSQEEIIWIELISFYLNMLIENTKKIEDLLKIITEMQSNQKQNLNWLQKLIFIKSEEEKKILAYELHDTILQELIQISREFEMIVYQHKNTETGHILKKLQNKIIDTTDEIRNYCENLAPPLINTIGLNAALDTLFLKVKTNANFKLNTKIDALNIIDEPFKLHIYRLVQEMINNAMKHSFANNVYIELNTKDEKVYLSYEDDGLGFNMSDVLSNVTSLGMNGMKERVYMLNGTIKINSKINEGVKIEILITR